MSGGTSATEKTYLVGGSRPIDYTRTAVTTMPNPGIFELAGYTPHNASKIRRDFFIPCLAH
jgi:hypothetical protein